MKKKLSFSSLLLLITLGANSQTTGYWNLQGNSGTNPYPITTPPLNFLGTSDDTPLFFGVAGQVEAPIKLTTSGRGKLTTCFAGEDFQFRYVSG